MHRKLGLGGISLSTPQGMQSCDYLRPLGSIAAGMVLCRVAAPEGNEAFKSGSLLWLTSTPSVVPSSARSERSCLGRNLLAGSHGVGRGGSH